MSQNPTVPQFPRVAVSVRGNQIRLTAERWVHIVEQHEELAGLLDEVLMTVAEPEAVFAGGLAECMAVREYDTAIWLVAVYNDRADGFVVTAFLTSRRAYFERRIRLWP